jgi:hypothetical protein
MGAVMVTEQDWVKERILPMVSAFCSERSQAFQQARRWAGSRPRIVAPQTLAKDLADMQIGLEVEAGTRNYLTRLCGPVVWDIHVRRDVSKQVDIEGFIDGKGARQKHYRLCVQEGDPGTYAYVHGLVHLRPTDSKGNHIVVPEIPWFVILACWCWGWEIKQQHFRTALKPGDYCYAAFPSEPFMKPMSELAAELKRRGRLLQSDSFLCTIRPKV